MSTRRFTTDRQREAARRNGAKSRGPVTDAGKRRAVANNQRHLLAAKSNPAIYDDPEYLGILDAYTREFDPASERERHLVHTMAVAQWRLRRNQRFADDRLERYALIGSEIVGPGDWSLEQLAVIGWDASPGPSLFAHVRYHQHDTAVWFRCLKALRAIKTDAPASKNSQFEPKRSLTPSHSTTTQAPESAPPTRAAAATKNTQFEPDRDSTAAESTRSGRATCHSPVATASDGSFPPHEPNRAVRPMSRPTVEILNSSNY